MKKVTKESREYFTKWLPVDGEIYDNQNVMFMIDHEWIGPASFDSLLGPDIQQVKQGRLCICSSQFMLGEKVFASGLIGKVTDIQDEHNVTVEYDAWINEGMSGGIGIYCIDPSCEDFDGDDSPIAVIGPVSDGAKWVEAGMYFTYSDIKIFNQISSGEVYHVKIKCHCCQSFQ